MINPAELVEALVAKLRAIPELVAEMEGDPERTRPYHDLYPKRVSLALAIYEMPVPSILVAWQGTTPGSFGASEARKHNLSLYLRARETLEVDPPTALHAAGPGHERHRVAGVLLHPSFASVRRCGRRFL